MDFRGKLVIILRVELGTLVDETKRIIVEELMIYVVSGDLCLYALYFKTKSSSFNEM